MRPIDRWLQYSRAGCCARVRIQLHGRPSLVSIVAIARSLSLMCGDPQVSLRSWIRWFYTEIARSIISASEWTRLQRKDKGVGKGAGRGSEGCGRYSLREFLSLPFLRYAGCWCALAALSPSASDRSDDSRAFVASDASSSYIP